MHHKIDIGILTIADPLWKGLEYEHIRNEELILAAPVTHPLTQKYKNATTINLKDFDKVPLS